jgi:formate dehydrogenase maturation protein FdhE
MGARLEWRLDHLDEITAAFKDGRAALEQKAIPTDPRARRAWLEKEMALLDTIEKMETDRVGATKRALKSLVEETIAKMDAAILAEEGKK